MARLNEIIKNKNNKNKKINISSALFKTNVGGETPLLWLITILFKVLTFSQGQFVLDHD